MAAAISAAEHAEILEENVRLKKKLADSPATKARKVTPADGLDDESTVEIIKARTHSRGFSLCKAIAYQLGVIPVEKCQEEIEAVKLFKTALEETSQYPVDAQLKSFHIPLGSELLPDVTIATKPYQTFKAMWSAGGGGVDRGEIEWLANKYKADPEHPVYKTAMSYLQNTIGGTLVAPPVQGELIELVRPNECLMNAGATRVPLPPNGKVTYPRQTGPTTMYWVGENTAPSESNPTTGSVNMSAKKGAVLVRVPNELLRYASVAADALIRNDTAKSLALGVDYAGLYGSGSASQPKGLTLYTGTNELIQYQSVTPAPKGIGTNGNTLRPEDGYRMIGLIEDRNFEFRGWIFRPTMANNIIGYRADAAAPADAAGTFVQGLMRAMAERIPSTTFDGYPVAKSAIVRNTLSKGSSSTLTEVFGGQWEHLLIGMHGAVEFASSDQSDNAFIQDQTVIRALIHCDIVPRYEGAFVWYPYLINSMN